MAQPANLPRLMAVFLVAPGLSAAFGSGSRHTIECCRGLTFVGRVDPEGERVADKPHRSSTPDGRTCPTRRAPNLSPCSIVPKVLALRASHQPWTPPPRAVKTWIRSHVPPVSRAPPTATRLWVFPRDDAAVRISEMGSVVSVEPRICSGVVAPKRNSRCFACASSSKAGGWPSPRKTAQAVRLRGSRASPRSRTIDIPPSGRSDHSPEARIT
jgi:hypothetical protein